MVKLGLFTDVHYAAGIREGTRYCHLGVQKLRVAMQAFRAAGVDVIIGLGDLVDSGETAEEEAGYLREVCDELASAAAPVHLVPGNHCLWTLTREQYHQISGQSRTWGSQDTGGWHLVFLDGCFRGDGVPYGCRNNVWTDALVSQEQVHWLAADLAGTRLPTLVFIHHRLDAFPPYGPANAPAVRQILERGGRVRAVFQGHEHGGSQTIVSGIRYITLPAMVEGDRIEHPAFAIVTGSASGDLDVQMP